MHKGRDDHILSPKTLLWVRGQALQDHRSCSSPEDCCLGALLLSFSPWSPFMPSKSHMYTVSPFSGAP